MFLTGPKIFPGQWRGLPKMPGLLLGEAQLKLKPEGQELRGALGPCQPHLAQARLCHCQDLSSAAFLPSQGCVRGSPLSDYQNGYQSVCCHIFWVHSGRCLMEFVGFLPTQFSGNSDLEVEGAGMAHCWP